MNNNKVKSPITVKVVNDGSSIAVPLAIMFLSIVILATTLWLILV